MNRDDVTRMARESGGFLGELPRGDAWLFAEEENLERFAALVASAEREACAMECIKKANAWTRLGAWGSNNEFHECANAIRARGLT